MIVAPPSRICRRSRHWSTFEHLFGPIPREDGALLYERNEIAFATEDPRHWWTVVDGDDGNLYAVAGWHLVNRVGYLCCQNAWGGDWNEHPDYLYD